MSSNLASLHEISSSKIIPSKPPASKNLNYRHSINYDFKAPKLFQKITHPPKTRPSMRSSIENLLFDDLSKNQQKDKKTENFQMDHSLKIKTLDKKDDLSISRLESNNLINTIDQKERNSLLDSPLNSYKGSAIESINNSKGQTENDNNEISPQEKKRLKTLKNTRKSLYFTSEQGKNIFPFKSNDFKLTKSKNNSRESSPNRNMTPNSKEKKVFNFLENSNSLAKEKYDKEIKSNLESYEKRMKVITEENEDRKPSQFNRISKLNNIDKKSEEDKIIIPDSKMFRPQIRGISPKFYHEQIIKKIDDKKRTGIDPERNISHKRSASGKPSKTNSISKAPIIIKGVRGCSTSKNNKKQEIYDFYIEYLRKVELIKFSFNFENVDKLKTANPVYFSIEIDNMKASSVKEIICLNTITSLYGKEYYQMLKKIFNMYSLESNGYNQVLSLRQFVKFGNEFFPELITNDKKLEIIFANVAANKQCDFMCFIEMLYKIQKETSKHQKQDKNYKKKQFQEFLDEKIVPKYKKLVSKLYEYNIEKIQVFFQNYNVYENAIVGLFYESHNFLKHIFSIYESQDIRKSDDCFIELKFFLKFSYDYKIIPVFFNSNQIIKLFRAYQKNNEEIIEFSSFIMILCCIAHIGFSSSEYLEIYKGFYKKIYQFISNLMEINNSISDNLVLDRLLKKF